MGDSYTDGTYELKKNSWPFLLEAALQKKKILVSKPLVLAKPGWTTTNLLDALEKQKGIADFDYVFVLIGVNNQYKGKPKETFDVEYPKLLDKSIALANGLPGNVIALSIPDWSVTPFARFKDKKRIVKELNAYNETIKTLAKNRKVNFIDITKVSRNAAVNPDWLVSDSLHPSKKMYKAWVKKIQKTISFQKR